MDTKTPKFVQITSAEAYFKAQNGVPMKHFTLFALDEEGCIWTRYFDAKDGTYREWYRLANNTTR